MPREARGRLRSRCRGRKRSSLLVFVVSAGLRGGSGPGSRGRSRNSGRPGRRDRRHRDGCGNHLFVQDPRRTIRRSGRRRHDRHRHDGRGRNWSRWHGLGSPGRGRRRRFDRRRHEDLRRPRRGRHDPRDGVLRRAAGRKRREHGAGGGERENRRPASGTVHRRLRCCPRSLSGEPGARKKGASAPRARSASKDVGARKAPEIAA